MNSILPLLSGFIFGIGLLISGMANPYKVIGFLDITGKWDPSLIFVMVSAIFFAYFPFQYAQKKKKTFYGKEIELPQRKEIDSKLILGSLLFGIGWGLAGFCPGPAIVALGAGKIKALVFTIAMLIGMKIDVSQKK